MTQEQLVRSRHVDSVEAPVNLRAYFICAFASVGGILFGYDSGYINGVLAMTYVKQQFGHPVPLDVDASGFSLETWQKSLIVSILSLGTFLGALASGSVADWIGRRNTISLSCGVSSVGVALQLRASGVELLVLGRLVSGLGLGGVSTAVVLYLSEIAPKAVRGTLVSVYQFAINLGLLLAACIGHASKNLTTSASYRIPIAVQFAWSLTLGLGLCFFPESPRYYVKRMQLRRARDALARIRGQPRTSDYIAAELAEITANYEYERKLTNTTWLDCFRGGLSLRANGGRVVVGTALQMFQQWTGVNFIFCRS
jgi:sugar porter (SP) family MFS transporter